MSIEDRCGGYFIAANFLGYLLKGQLFLGFGIEQSRCRSGEVGMLRFLLVLAVVLKLEKIGKAHVKRSERHVRDEVRLVFLSRVG